MGPDSESETTFPPQILRVVMFHAAFSIGLLTYYFWNLLIHDDDDGMFVNPIDFQAGPMILVCFSALVSLEIGRNSVTRLRGAGLAGLSNAIGSGCYSLTLVIMETEPGEIVNQLMIMCFVAGFTGALAGCVGTTIPFNSKLKSIDHYSSGGPVRTEIHQSSLPEGGGYVKGANGETVYLAPDGSAWTRTSSGTFVQTTPPQIT